MSSKRKMPPMGLERRVRPRREDEWEPESDVGDDESSAVSEEAVSGDEDDEEQDESEGSSAESGSDSESEEEPDAPQVDVSSISFGALAKAQAFLKKQKRDGAEDGADSHRTRDDANRSSSTTKRPPKPKRSSKHAPQEQSSKRPVSRIFRDTLPTETSTKRAAPRDPRFDPISGDAARISEAKASKAYAFLDEYRDKELADLRAQAKKAKDPPRKEELKRQIMSIESRRKARKHKEEEERLLAEHRKKEKEFVAQGKQPFYLKRSEQKKQLLVNRFAGMSKGQVDRAIERKRKKVAGKEKKELDSLQRVTGRQGTR